jgi:hypothetical protein
MICEFTIPLTIVITREVHYLHNANFKWYDHSHGNAPLDQNICNRFCKYQPWPLTLSSKLVCFCI